MFWNLRRHFIDIASSQTGKLYFDGDRLIFWWFSYQNPRVRRYFCVPLNNLLSDINLFKTFYLFLISPELIGYMVNVLIPFKQNTTTEEKTMRNVCLSSPPTSILFYFRLLLVFCLLFSAHVIHLPILSSSKFWLLTSGITFVYDFILYLFLSILRIL